MKEEPLIIIMSKLFKIVIVFLKNFFYPSCKLFLIFLFST